MRIDFGKNRIGRRIVVLVFTSVMISIVCVTSLFLWFQLQDNLATRRSAVEATGYVYASAIADHVAAGNRQEAFKVLRSITRVPGIVYAAAVDGQGHEIAALGSAIMSQRDLVPFEAGTYSLLEYGVLPVKISIVHGGVSAGQLIVAADVSGIRWQLAKAALITLVSAFAASLLGTAFAIRLQRRITTPILSLTAAMRHIRDAGDYSLHVDHAAEDETGILVGTFNGMITEIRSRDHKLEQLAYFDTLTGLPNRRHLENHIERLQIAQISDVALAIIDINEFKEINESYGLDFGDALLVAVAAGLKDYCPRDVFIARLGGDEFAVVMTGRRSEPEIRDTLASLMAPLMKPLNTQGRDIFLDMLVGVTVAPQVEDAGTLLRRADLALNEGKRRGKRHVQFYDSEVDKIVLDRTALVHDLRQAIATGGLEVHFQPQVDLRDGTVSGYEALVRWRHPQRGFVSPAVFIPMAETSGLICDIGLWVLRQSCLAARAWIDAGESLRIVSVNLSAVQIMQQSLISDVVRVLSETGLPSKFLCLELTESLFIGGSRTQARERLESLKALGITLAIDDFGTGYSSLSYLRELPFDKLKIDRAFVSGIDASLGKRNLLEGILALSHALGLGVVAEGAETDGEVQVLRELGAEEVQGYAFAKPVPAAEVAAVTQRILQEFDGRFPTLDAGWSQPKRA